MVAVTKKPRTPKVTQCPLMKTWTVVVSVLNDDGWFRPHKLAEGFDTEARARNWAEKRVVCPTCDGSGQITLTEYPTPRGETTLAVCIDCNGARVKPRK